MPGSRGKPHTQEAAGKANVPTAFAPSRSQRAGQPSEANDPKGIRLPWAADAIRRLNEAQIPITVLTNRGGISFDVLRPRSPFGATTAPPTQ